MMVLVLIGAVIVFVLGMAFVIVWLKDQDNVTGKLQDELQELRQRVEEMERADRRIHHD